MRLKVFASHVAEALIDAVGGVQLTALTLIIPLVVLPSTGAAANAISVGGLLNESVVDPAAGTAMTVKVIESMGSLAVRYGAAKSTPTNLMAPVVLLNDGPINEFSSLDILVTAVT